MSDEQKPGTIKGYALRWNTLLADGTIIRQDALTVSDRLLPKGTRLITDSTGVQIEFEPTVVDGRIVEVSMVPRRERE